MSVDWLGEVMQRDIHLGILSSLDMLEGWRWPAVANLLSEVYPGIVPERYGTCDPLREAFDPEHPGPFIALMSGSLHWKRRIPRGSGFWFPGTRHRWIHAYVHLKIDATRGDAAKLTDFLLAASQEMRADFAYMHELVDQDLPILCAAGSGGWLNRSKGAYSLNVTTHILRRFIPDLYWATVFGPPYVELFGRERLLSAPAPIVRELEGGAVYLQLSETPADFHTDFARVDTVRQQVKAHLDSNAFFDLSAPTDHVYNTPKFKLQPPPGPGGFTIPGASEPLVDSKKPVELQESDPELLRLVAAHANDAVRIAREQYRLELDYSADSVRRVEEILRRIFARSNRRVLGLKTSPSLSDEEITNLAGVWGSYVGEVFRRHFGGIWYWDRSLGPDPIAALRIGGMRLFPPAKVYKRLTQGEGDNVWFYFQAMSERIPHGS